MNTTTHVTTESDSTHGTGVMSCLLLPGLLLPSTEESLGAPAPSSSRPPEPGSSCSSSGQPCDPPCIGILNSTHGVGSRCKGVVKMH
jgi:hypothetical protein